MEIKKVIICGLGAVGLTYANKLKDICELKILADEKRVEKYKNNPPVFNGNPVSLNYITPHDSFTPDLIIIATKNDGLDSVIEYIRNFVGENTIIISLINGITSEEKIAEVYGWDKVLHSYFIGDSAIREGNNVIQDGVGKIVFGTPYRENSEKVQTLKNFLEKNSIDYENPQDIIYSMWLKLAVNACVNQISAILKITFEEMKNDNFIRLSKEIIKEVKTVAEKEGVKNLENLEADALGAISKMAGYGKTSMLQDILAGRKTEVDIFSGEIIKRGKKHNVLTPCNQILYSMIKTIER